MPRKRLKTLISITRDLGCEPGEYLAHRLKAHIDAGNHDAAVKLANDLMPYTRSKLRLIEHTGEDGGPLRIKVIIGGDDAD